MYSIKHPLIKHPKNCSINHTTQNLASTHSLTYQEGNKRVEVWVSNFSHQVQ